MKLYGVTKVMIPWFDDKGMKQWQLLTYRPQDNKTSYDKRWLLSTIIAHIKKSFGLSRSKSWVLKNCSIINCNQPDLDISHDHTYKQFIDDMVERLAWKEGDGDGEADDEATPADKAEDVVEAGAEVRPVLDTPAEPN